MISTLEKLSEWFFGIVVAFIVCVFILWATGIILHPSLDLIFGCMAFCCALSLLSLVCDWVAAFLRRRSHATDL